MTESQHDIQRLLDIMARLRDRESGCPWDIEQTFSTIAPYTIEEAYEVADAIDRNDLPALRDELGDLLLQVVFHARMAQEQGAFAFADVVDAISDKMTRRHPHVFGPSAGSEPAPDLIRGQAFEAVADAAAQTVAWDEHKRREREANGDGDTSALAGIARGLPEWQLAIKLQNRAAKVGFDWPGPAPVIEKLHEEIEEVRAEFAAVAGDPESTDAQHRLEDEIGDLLFVCANLARHARVDVGSALRRANLKFERRFRAMETLAAIDGSTLAGLPLERQDRYWDRAKAAEKSTPEHGMRRFASFREFYPFYLSEHQNTVSRRLHFIGSCGVLALVAVAIVQRNGWWLLAALLCGYGFAWIGHFFFEKNRPATFKHPLYSLLGDWVMFKDILAGKVKF